MIPDDGLNPYVLVYQYRGMKAHKAIGFLPSCRNDPVYGIITTSMEIITKCGNRSTEYYPIDWKAIDDSDYPACKRCFKWGSS